MTGFEEVDEPATNDEINQWWGKHSVQLVGFVVMGHHGPEGVTHWLAVTKNLNGWAELYRLCGTMDDALPWTRVPGASVTCMTCLVRAARDGWKKPG